MRGSSKTGITRKPISRRIAVAGLRPATMKLIEIGPDSFTLFRSSSKIGTARVEEDGRWSARFTAPDGRFTAFGKSAAELLEQVGRYLLLGEARDTAARPLEETMPELREKKRRSAEELLSLKLLRQAQAHRIATLEAERLSIRKTLRKR